VLAALGLTNEDLSAKLGQVESVEDLRACALALAMRGRRPDRLQAISCLEQVARRRPLEADDQFLLAQQYEAVGDWPKAKAQMLSLLEKHGNNLLYLLQYANSLVSHDQVGEARTVLRTLKDKIGQDVYATRALEAQLLIKEGKGQEAADLLLGHATKDPGDLAASAGLLEKHGLFGPAEELYRRLVVTAKQPQAVLRLAEFLGRHGKPTEALALCDQAWQTCPADRVADTCVAVLYAARLGDEAVRHIGGRIEAALQKEPKSPTLLMHLATFKNYQGQYQEAADLYLRVLELEPKRVQALNNLAWLLAFRPNAQAEALKAIDGAIAIAGPAANLLDTRGVIHLLAGRAEQAVQDLERSAEETPDPSTFFHLAQAYWRGHNRGSATAALRKATSLGLKPEDLHPLERPAYHQLASELGAARASR
jgi:tetratricopeptide (TPR) repeat protein